jgi:hypothetical protein
MKPRSSSQLSSFPGRGATLESVRADRKPTLFGSDSHAVGRNDAAGEEKDSGVGKLSNDIIRKDWHFQCGS